MERVKKRKRERDRERERETSCRRIAHFISSNVFSCDAEFGSKKDESSEKEEIDKDARKKKRKR